MLEAITVEGEGLTCLPLLLDDAVENLRAGVIVAVVRD